MVLGHLISALCPSPLIKKCGGEEQAARSYPRRAEKRRVQQRHSSASLTSAFLLRRAWDETFFLTKKKSLFLKQGGRLIPFAGRQGLCGVSCQPTWRIPMTHEAHGATKDPKESRGRKGRNRTECQRSGAGYDVQIAICYSKSSLDAKILRWARLQAASC